MDKFLNFFSKYPWVAMVIVMHWIATTIFLINRHDIDVTMIMGITFFCTLIYAYFGFKVPKG
ncbi:hypothetical protein BH11PAT1_BH11PAT1_0980 [soil metagenome]